MNTLLGALRFTLRGAGVWIPDPTLHNPAYIAICIVQNSSNIQVKVEVKATLRSAAHRQSVRPGAKAPEPHEQRFFSSTEPLRS
jgi:hypothetical protein